MSRLPALPTPRIVGPLVDDPIEAGLDPDLALPRLIELRAAWNAAQPFLVEVGGASASYGEVYDMSLRWADALRRWGLRRHDRVVQLSRPSVSAHTTWLGVAYAGGVEVPANLEVRGEMLAAVLADAEPRVIVTDGESLTALLEVVDGLASVELVVVRGAVEDDVVAATETRIEAAHSFLSGAQPQPPLTVPGPHDIACALYTSGTTGAPKGVLVPWAEFASVACMIPTELVGDAIYTPWPIFHLAGKNALIQMAAIGGRVVLRDRPSVSRFWDDVRAYVCTHAVIGFIVDRLEAAAAKPDDAENPLRSVIMGPCVPDIEAFQRRFRLRVLVVYGSTEMGIPLAQLEVDNRMANTTAGRPRRGYEARILGAEGGPLPDGQIGELEVRAADTRVMSRGYIRRGDAPVDDAGWLATGDAFRRDANGLFWFAGRYGDRIRRRGENLNPLDIEAVALGHELILEAAAFAVPGDPEDEIHLAVVVSDMAWFTPADLHEWMRERLPRAMVPRYVSRCDRFPKTDTTQRVRKADLRERLELGAAWDATFATAGTDARARRREPNAQG